MNRLIAWIKAPWLLPLLGVLLLSLLVWLFGPLLAFGEAHPLDGVVERLAVIAVLLLLWAVVVLWRRNRDHQADQAVVAAMTRQDDAKAEAAEEVAVLARRMAEAIDDLRRSRLGGEEGGRQLLYQLPWYIIIGPPGAGKTTALVNSGLSFPLADKLGKQPVGGIGGTRNCDWWFTNQAVLIDTAGRYTTQDSQQEVDAAAWTGFLDLLKRHRPRQPINGVLVAISLYDLAALNEADRAAHAQAVRLRLRELYDRLGVRFPVYVLFTKADLMAGFTEFFADLGKEQREQVWGATFPLDDGMGDDGAVARFGAEFDALLERLDTRLLDRLQQEQDPARRGLIYGLPQQLASLRDLAQGFLEEVFQASRYHHRPLLRGFYFTSGTQYGTPIDRLMGGMAQAFGLPRQPLAAFSGSGRSYFLTRLIRDVVFGEASLVRANAKVEQRRLLIGRLALAGSLVATVGGIAVLANSYVNNSALIDTVEREAAAYAKVAEALPPPGTQPDLKVAAAALAALRGLTTGYDQADQPAGVSRGWGLYQGDKLHVPTTEAYRRGLNYILLPRLLLRLEAQMQAHARDPAFLFEALQIYLMLGRQRPPAQERIALWLATDWAAQYPGPDNQTLRDDLARHAAALLDGEMAAIPLDGDLVAQVRETLRAVPPAARIYTLIRQTSAAVALPEWRPIDKAGPAADAALVRPSGKPLTQGIPGLFTRDGFHRVVLPRVGEISRQVAEESWVLGEAGNVALDLAKAAELRRDVLNLYYDDYAKHWDGLLADLAVTPFRDLGHAAEVLNILAGPASPLRSVMAAAAAETLLSKPPSGTVATPEAVADQAAAAAMAQNQKLQQLGKLLGADSGPAQPPGKTIDDRYQRLRDMVAGSPSPLDDVLRSLNDLYVQINAMANASSQREAALAAAASGGGAAQKLQSDASRLPQPVAGMLGAVARYSTGATVGGARSQLNALWTTSVLPFCRQAVNGRYPLNRGAADEVTLQDFTALFGPSGMMQQFFAGNLARFVDTARKPWRWQKVEQVNLGLSAASLAEFERAAAIREVLFPGNAAQVQVAFELVPLAIDPAISEIAVDIAGQRLSFGHAAAVPTRLVWPGAAVTAVSVTAVSGGKPETIAADGPWALLRVLDRADLQPGAAADRFRLSFSFAAGSASFELRAASVRNIFRLRELEQFRCPPSL